MMGIKATRSDAQYFDGPLNGLSFPIDSRPSIKWRHIDGPLLTFSDGQMHWLTLRERVRVCLGLEDEHTLQANHRPRLTGYLHVMRSKMAS
jgi:hypothetical protein